MIIYPPFIADTIPAFTEDKIVIPFEQNPAVGFQEITYFGLIVKNYTDSKIAAYYSVPVEDCIYNPETKQGEAIFDIARLKALKKALIELDTELTEEEKIKAMAEVDAFPKKKQYYKFQMSYTDDEVASFDTSFSAYSTASVGRCIGAGPTIEIVGAENAVMKPQPYLNIVTKTFIGKYTSDISSEPLRSYRIYVKEKATDIIVQDSGVILYNTDNDLVTREKRTSTHTFILNYELERNKQYLINYEITTINGFVNTVEYALIKEGRLPIPFEGDLYVGQDARAIDNGYIQITLLGPPCKGEFILERTENGKDWVTLTSFSLTKLSKLGEVDHNNRLIKKGDFTWTDWSVEQGVKYTYAISQYSGNEYSERKMATPFMAEFEHMFLSDGEKQLKIAFNPRVSSLKETILEQKTDTIGSKYPYFFRNGHVRYKELPISGLLSYHMDEDELFISMGSLGLTNDQYTRELTPSQDNFNATIPTVGLTGYNFSAERKFKLSVLEWLNNGKKKLFRSPAEGNYVVRLMNTSLSPNDTLGRLLHTFSSTGYEVAPSDANSLMQQNLISMPQLQDAPPSKIIKTIQFSNIENWDCNDGQGYNVLWETKANGQANLSRPKLNPPHIPGTIQNIQWYSAKPNLVDTISISDTNKTTETQVINNVSGIFATPPTINYDSVIITKPKPGNEENYASTLTFEYMPDLTEMQGEDAFAKMVAESADILFSSPAGTTLRGENAILTAVDSQGNPIPGTYENIYKTYVLIVRKDDTYQGDDECCLYFYDYNDVDNLSKYKKIDCSDGQIRYYYNIEPNIMYDKTKGLHIDIYARLGGTRETLSSRLGYFVLGSSRLGIS